MVSYAKLGLVKVGLVWRRFYYIILQVRLERKDSSILQVAVVYTKTSHPMERNFGAALVLVANTNG